ncbi:vesicle-associated membrane protein 3-like [Zophobas morio]|uniref:vesicle-associated membrane protein 3-like n=1 Tax=Zophobas morio TaxID=2755281 RepID=UPI0030834A51
MFDSKDNERDESPLLGSSTFYYEDKSPKRLSNMEQVKTDLTTVTTIARDNLFKVVERGEQLIDLETRSENLSAGADLFNTRARGVKRNMWWNNKKGIMIFSGIFLLIVVIVVFSQALSGEKNILIPTDSITN